MPGFPFARLRAEALRLPARSRFGGGRARKHGNDRIEKKKGNKGKREEK